MNQKEKMTSKITIDGHDYDLKKIVDRSLLLHRLTRKKSNKIFVDGIEFDYSKKEQRKQIYHILEQRAKGCDEDYFIMGYDSFLIEGEK